MDLESAKEGFKMVIAAAPGSAEAKEAQTFLSTAFPKGTVSKASIAHYRDACIAGSINRRGEAIDLLKKCILADPNFDWAYGALGQILTTDKQYPEAEKVLLRAVAQNPDYMRGYLRLSELYAAMGKAQESKEMRHKAEQLNPYDESLHVNPTRD